MRVYHGSTRKIEFPSVRVKIRTKDFSWGFYCTDDLQRARVWTSRHKDLPILNVYDYKEADHLNILKFEEMNDEWLDFIEKCRRGFVHHYDIVKGPMLDDLVKGEVEQYYSGKLKRNELWERLQDKKPISLISFHTVRALTHLKYIGSEEVSLIKEEK